MILRGIAKRYAVALFNAALNEETADQVGGDIAAFTTLLRDNPNFNSYLGSPQVLTEAKKDLIVQAIGDRASGLFLNFLMLLIDKKRLENLPEIAEAYTALWEEHQGIVEARVITAVPLDGELEEKTARRIHEQTGKEVRLIKRVDPRIVGGMIIIIDNNIIDGSVRHQLGEIRKSVAELKVH